MLLAALAPALLCHVRHAPQRHAAPLAVAGVAEPALLWPDGVVHYLVATAGTHGAAAAPLAADDPRVAVAVAEWAVSTCLTFVRCSSAAPAACPQPHIEFIASDTCRSAVGRRGTAENPIYISEDCTAGAIMHEIGHAIGLVHTHERRDAVDYVYVDRSQIVPGQETDFDEAPLAETVLQLGAYDYDSIMHLPADAYARGALPTIIAPVAIGQRDSLSSGDTLAVDFLYHNCSDEYAAPTCMASRDVMLIPFDEAWGVDFTGVFNDSMHVSYTDSTVPPQMLRVTVAEGGVVEPYARVTATFIPSPAEAGRTFTIAARFTAMANRNLSVECAVAVRVATAGAVCFNVSGDDPAVCSGRGVCQKDPARRCVCDDGYVGLQCERAFSLADVVPLWTGGAVPYLVAIDETHRNAPVASLAADDARVTAAVSAWAAATCITFEQCDPATPDACPTPHLKFVSSATGCRGLTPTGRQHPTANPLYISPNCTPGAVMHEIGHALGLTDTHTRPDAPEHIYIDRAQVAPGQAALLDASSAAAMRYHLGAYDYNSIMHLPADAYARGALPTIVAPVPIGQRTQLSPGDIAAVEFMYHGCSDVYAAPTCMASRDAGRATLIPYGKAWGVEFTGVYSSGMKVSYVEGNVPPGLLLLSVDEGAAVGPVAVASLTFMPTVAEVGAMFRIAAKFTSQADASRSVVCSVDVVVASSSTVCYGVAGDDPAVCSGHGVCNDGPAQRCGCDEGYAGAWCGSRPLWPGAEVNYLVALTESDAADPAAFLAADDMRITEAVAGWDDATCLKFTRCDPVDPSGCAAPLLKFVSTGGVCRAEGIGRRSDGATLLYVSDACTAGDIMHEIGRVLGLAHTHQRPDTLDHVYVDRSQIAPGDEDRFDDARAPDALLHLGAYDYDSIMHLGSHAYARSVLPTIIAPVPIGQRTQLSPGDIAAVEFMYHGCSDVYAAPTCMASRDSGATTLIPYGKMWGVEFTGVYNDRMRVSYAGSTVPMGIMATAVAEGGVVDPIGTAAVQITPTPASPGGTYTVSATFTSMRDPALAVTCAVTITVAAADTVCYGVAGNDPAVCSGHGVCSDNPERRCVCAAGYSGVRCERLRNWAGGRVNYIIALTESDPSNPAQFLAADDARVREATAAWTAATCVEFMECDPITPAACPPPFIKFISTSGPCRSPVGRQHPTANPLYISPNCTPGAVMHEIGHALGLTDTHTRPDAPEHIYIDRAQVAPGQAALLDASSAAAMRYHLGAYDYNSIMHLPADAYARGALPTIIAPVPIGQRTQLSPGDIAAVEFMYHGCSDVYAAPTCMASRDAGRATLIPYGKAWGVEFTGVYSSGMKVSYVESNASLIDFSVVEGGVIDAVGTTVVQITPAIAEAGRTIRLAVNFTSTADPSLTVLCGVHVVVASSDTVCYGVAGDDAAVCSGHGVCQDDPAQRCVCNGGYTGVVCEEDTSSPVPLWTGGVVHYLVAMRGSDPAAPAAFLEAEDARVAAAVAAWGDATCLTFEACDPVDPSACPTPHLEFLSSGRECGTALGRRADGANPVYVTPECTALDLSRVVGHALGFPFAHDRFDAPEYVYIDRAQVAPGFAQRLTVSRPGDTLLSLGAYDYDSIMHLPADAYARGALPTIVAPVPIGQRTQLSPGDIAAVEFMYHGCSDVYAAPTCMASRDAGRATLIPYGKAWGVEFTGMFNESMRVAYLGSTVPEARLTTSVPSGGVVDAVGVTTMSVRPAAGDAGATYRLAAVFTAVRDPLLSVTCGVDVVVASSDTVCYGVAGDDAGVCSGHGVCTDDPSQRCACSDGYAGVRCEDDTEYRASPDYDASPEGRYEAAFVWCEATDDCTVWGDAGAVCDAVTSRCVCSDGYGPVVSRAGRRGYYCVPPPTASDVLNDTLNAVYILDYPRGACPHANGTAQAALLSTLREVFASVDGIGAVVGGAWMCGPPPPRPGVPAGTRVAIAVNTTAQRLLDDTPPTLAGDIAQATRFIPAIDAAVGGDPIPDISINAPPPSNITDAACVNVTNASLTYTDIRTGQCTPLRCLDSYALDAVRAPHGCNLTEGTPLYATSPEYKETPEYLDSPVYKASPEYKAQDDDDDGWVIALVVILVVLALCLSAVLAWWFLLRKRDIGFEFIVNVWVPVDPDTGELCVEGVRAAGADVDATPAVQSPRLEPQEATAVDATRDLIATPRSHASSRAEIVPKSPADFPALLPPPATQPADDAKPARPKPGVRITRVYEGSGADKAGLAPGQVILSIDKRPVHTMHELTAAVAARKKPDGVWVSVGVPKPEPTAADTAAAAGVAAALATTASTSGGARRTSSALKRAHFAGVDDLQTPLLGGAPVRDAERGASVPLSPAQAMNQALLDRYRVNPLARTSAAEPNGFAAAAAPVPETIGREPSLLRSPRQHEYSPPVPSGASPVSPMGRGWGRNPYMMSDLGSQPYSPIIDPEPVVTGGRFSPLPVAGMAGGGAAAGPRHYNTSAASPAALVQRESSVPPAADGYVERNVYCPSRGVCALPFLEITNDAPPRTRTLVVSADELRCEANSGVVERVVPLEHVVDVLHTDDGLVGMLLPAQPVDWCMQLTPQYAKTFLVAFGDAFLQRTGMPFVARRLEASTLVLQPLQSLLRLDAPVSPQAQRPFLLEGP